LNQTHSLRNFHINNWASYQLVAGVPFPDVVEVTYVRRVSPPGRLFDLEVFQNFPNNANLAEATPNFISIVEI
jgi:hypothetical protein